jgi:hypothetical protein
MQSLLNPWLPAGTKGFIAPALFVYLGLGALPSAAQHVEVIPEMKHAVSAPLRTLADRSVAFWEQDRVSDDTLPERSEARAAAVRLVDPLQRRTTSTALVTIPGMNYWALERASQVQADPISQMACPPIRTQLWATPKSWRPLIWQWPCLTKSRDPL